jgi:predicted DNA-binding transcriptional regulator YafY
VVRVITEMRNYGAPIDYDRERNGYLYDPHRAFELPGIWFTPGEVAALITAHDLLANAEPGLLKETLAPLKAKLDGLLKLDHLGAGELPKRVRILRMAGRGPGTCFASVAQALVARRQLVFDYRARATGEASHRRVSPQRLTHYRDNWYLDAWCHQRKALRSFALERIENAKMPETKSREVAESTLHAHFATAYGIFAGTPKAIARLVFSAFRARWVAEENWHPAQRGEFLPDGRYQLDIPYGDPRELLMDTLKHGNDVEVVAPLSLRTLVAETLKASLLHYADAPNPAPDKAFGGITD